MALIGNLCDLGKMFNKSESLQILYKYLLEAIDIQSNIHNRIMNLNCNSDRIENKIDLGFGMTAIEQSYRLGIGGRFESHNKFVDFQLMVNGNEYMEFGSIKDFKIYREYDSTRDVVLYESITNVSKILLKNWNLAVFFPYDIHRGGILFSDEIVYKSVVKVPIQLLKFCF